MHPDLSPDLQFQIARQRHADRLATARQHRLAAGLRRASRQERIRRTRRRLAVGLLVLARRLDAERAATAVAATGALRPETAAAPKAAALASPALSAHGPRPVSIPAQPDRSNVVPLRRAPSR